MRVHGDVKYTAELRRPVALASYELFAIMFFAINQNSEQLNWETLAGKSSHRKVELINRVRGYRLDCLDG